MAITSRSLEKNPLAERLGGGTWAYTTPGSETISKNFGRYQETGKNTYGLGRRIGIEVR